jgi:hypothetical protein
MGSGQTRFSVTGDTHDEAVKLQIRPQPLRGVGIVLDDEDVARDTGRRLPRGPLDRWRPRPGPGPRVALSDASSGWLALALSLTCR